MSHSKGHTDRYHPGVKATAALQCRARGDAASDFAGVESLINPDDAGGRVEAGGRKDRRDGAGTNHTQILAGHFRRHAEQAEGGRHLRQALNRAAGGSGSMRSQTDLAAPGLSAGAR